MRGILFPFSLLYGIVVVVRNKCFDWGILKQASFPVPVISIGNITMGGTGKTPHSEFLIQWLKKNYRVALLSRGYKRQSTGFYEVSLESTAIQVGDEPLQIKHKFPDIIVAVDEKRKHGIEQLMTFHNKPELVILDDAFQHRHVKPTWNILLIDYNRPIFQDFILPVGNLREPANGKKRAHCVIVTKCPLNMSDYEMEKFKQGLNLRAEQHLYFTTFSYGDLTPVFNTYSGVIHESELRGASILALSGIANPDPFYRYLESLGITQLMKFEFPDHHHFTNKDFTALQQKFEHIEESKKYIVTTEKDATRMRTASGKELLKKFPIYYLPVDVVFLKGEAPEFKEVLLRSVMMT